MSQHDQTVYVRHMLDAARKALGYTLGKTKQDLLINELLSLAIVQLLQILGEAARRTSAEYRATTPQIPWRQIIGTRDRLAHGYDQVNYDTVWTILTDELPPLIAKLEQLVPPEAAP
jgi:uncharacterized protein with HEPN domain